MFRSPIAHARSLCLSEQPFLPSGLPPDILVVIWLYVLAFKLFCVVLELFLVLLSGPTCSILYGSAVVVKRFVAVSLESMLALLLHSLSCCLNILSCVGVLKFAMLYVVLFTIFPLFALESLILICPISR